MKRSLLFTLLNLTLIAVQGQDTALFNRVNKLSSVKHIPFYDCNRQNKDCGDELIWQIVKFGRPAISLLINKISDSSFSKVKSKDLDSFITLRTGDMHLYACRKLFLFR